MSNILLKTLATGVLLLSLLELIFLNCPQHNTHELFAFIKLDHGPLIFPLVPVDGDSILLGLLG